MIWGSHSGGYEEYYLLGYNALWSVESQQTSRKNMSASSSCLVYSSTLMMEATSSSEKPVDFQRTAPRYISEDIILLLHPSLCYLLLHYHSFCPVHKNPLRFTSVSGSVRILGELYSLPPITVVARSETWTVLTRSNTGVVGSNPTQGMDVCVCFYSVFVLSCL
jgi:hypothetical protein